MTNTASAFRICSYNLRGCAKNDKILQMEKLIVATKYHDIVGLLDTHLNQDEVDVMVKNNNNGTDKEVVPAHTELPPCCKSKLSCSKAHLCLKTRA